MQSREIRLKSYPEGLPTPDDFELATVELPDPADGEVLVRNHYMSVDPYMRGRMRDSKSYAPPFALGAPLNGHSVGEVVTSTDPDFKPGDAVAGFGGWRDHCIASGADLVRVDPTLAPLQTYLGTLGMPGMTAYVGLLDIGRPEKGQTVFVSAASGAVGSIVGQIAKIKGCRVVGSAGSDEKIAWLEGEAGFDAAFNYKRADHLNAELTRHCPDGIDVYFDNVGGPVLDAVMAQISSGARIALCGSIAEYNEPTGQRQGPSLNRIAQGGLARIEGFNQGQYQDRHEEALALLAMWVRRGTLQYKEDIVVGLEKAPEAFIGMMQGKNFGKVLVQVSDDPTR